MLDLLKEATGKANSSSLLERLAKSPEARVEPVIDVEGDDDSLGFADDAFAID